MAAYFLAKVSSGKDSTYKPFEGSCSRCRTSVLLKDGVGIKSPNKRLKRLGKAYSFKELVLMFEKFAAMEAEDWAKKMKVRVEPDDNMVRFLVQRTNICPHRIITPESRYWLETINLMDGELGFCLDRPVDEFPAYFFDAVGIVRSQRDKVNKEDRQNANKNNSNKDHGRQ